MASKFIISCIWNTESNTFTDEILGRMMDISHKLQIKWGAEYVNFHYSNSSLDDPDVEEILQKLNLSVPRKDRFVPEGGSYSLIGHLPNARVEVKDYSRKEFCDLCLSSSGIVAITENLPVSQSFDPFEVQIQYVTDYSRTVTVLEERGLLQTIPSENFLSVDERRFIFHPSSRSYVGEIANYSDTPYEVDSLGTNFHRTLTALVVALFHLSEIKS
jgi:hypothetical protein